MASTRPISGSVLRGNAFLRSLKPADAALLAPLMTFVECRAGQQLAMSDGHKAAIHFPLTLVVSLGLDGDGGGWGLIGREGLIGWPAILGLEQNDHGAQVLFDGGTALAVPVTRMQVACFASPTLSMSLLRFVQSYTLQLTSMLKSSGSDSVRQRLSAWLLMLHDRVDGDTIALTHQCLSRHLQVRRASITDALHVLEGEQALRCDRNAIVVRNRALLELCAGRAYGRTEEAYRSSIGPFGKGQTASIPLAAERMAAPFT